MQSPEKIYDNILDQQKEGNCVQDNKARFAAKIFRSGRQVQFAFMNLRRFFGTRNSFPVISFAPLKALRIFNSNFFLNRCYLHRCRLRLCGRLGFRIGLFGSGYFVSGCHVTSPCWKHLLFTAPNMLVTSGNGKETTILLVRSSDAKKNSKPILETMR